jgi:hypothetical protein
MGVEGWEGNSPCRGRNGRLLGSGKKLVYKFNIGLDWGCVELCDC